MLFVYLLAIVAGIMRRDGRADDEFDSASLLQKSGAAR